MWFRLDQIAEYCEQAALNGVTELALTEHSHRFVDVASVVGPFWRRLGHEPTSATMAEYWDFHARNSLEAYVTLAQAQAVVFGGRALIGGVLTRGVPTTVPAGYLPASW